MKTNHEKLLLHIEEAIKSCSYDDVLSSAKKHLYEALSIVKEVSKKRDRRTATEEFRQKAVNKNNEWMKMLKDNISPPDLTT